MTLIERFAEELAETQAGGPGRSEIAGIIAATAGCVKREYLMITMVVRGGMKR